MLSDVVEGIFSFIIEIIFRIIVEAIFFYTGEVVLWVITFGKKQPRWDYYSNETVTKFMLMTELSTWAGFAFWFSIIIYITN